MNLSAEGEICLVAAGLWEHGNVIDYKVLLEC